MKIKKLGVCLASILSAFMLMSVVLAPVGMVAYAESVVGEDIYDIDINTVINDDVVVPADAVWAVAWGDDCVVVINGNLTLEDGDPDDDIDGGDLTVDSNGLVIVNGDLYVGVNGTLSNFGSNSKVVVTGTVTIVPGAAEISDGVLVRTDLQNIAYVDGTIGQDAYFTSGGKFYTFNGSEFVEFTPPVTTTFVAQVGDTKYETLEEALAAAPSGATVKLLEDIDYSTTYTERNARDNGREHAVDLRNLTLNMNGNTISTINATVVFGGNGATITNGSFHLVPKNTDGSYKAGSYALIIDNTPFSYGPTGTVSVEDVTMDGGINLCNATVTIDEVTAETTATKFYAVWAESDATVTINSGTFTDAQTGGRGVIATGQTTEGGAVLNINGGTFNAGNKVVASAEADSIKISGGTFTKAVAEEYCADGFNPVDNGNGTYGVAPVSASVEITAKDAYVDYDGMGYLRFVSTVNITEGSTVEYFGTWFIPENLLNDTTKEKGDIRYNGSIESGKFFTADLIGIPATQLDRVIAGVSYVKIEGASEVQTDVATATVEEWKNETSN